MKRALIVSMNPTQRDVVQLKQRFVRILKKASSPFFAGIFGEGKSITITKRKTLKRTVKPKEPKVVIYYGYQVEAPVKTYLNKLVFKTPVKNMRKIAQEMDLYIPLQDYPTDKRSENT